MPPSPGKIHSLPVKVLYSINTSPQSYLAILNERQDVYIHPNTPEQSSDDPQRTLGSCSLKSISRGICFASPECIPNSTSLDFSVYNLDPSLRVNRTDRAFPNPAGDDPSSWTGRGFLSWLLAEPAAGQTLIKGRLVREYEFSPLAFNEGGGLEGLLARSGHREEIDGKGWGLEVCVSLRQVNPEGKSEFAGRRAFEEMLARGREMVGSSRRSSPPASARMNGSASSQQAASSSNLGSSAAVRPVPVVSRPSPASSHRPSFPSSVPPSSIPMAASSSSVIPSRPSSAADQRSPLVRPPTANAPKPDASRPVTPPPPPARRSPPPSTPSRTTLHALLRSDGKMSPELAKHLANNPMLLRLLKAVPTSAVPLTSPSGKGSPRAETPTPSSTRTIKASASLMAEPCCNCGTSVTDLWRTKNMPDGTKKRVCNGCGLYFNKHKRMRPREMWGDEGQAEALPKLDGTSGVRSSPRLHPSVSDNGHSSVQESPRKRQRTNKMALPSPRMATRASAKTEDSKPLDFAGPLFSPTTLFGTSPALPIPPDPVLGGGETEGLGDVDIENLLAQLANNEHGFDLDALFAGAASGDGGSGGQEMLDLLSAWEGASGSVTEQKDGTA